MNMDSLKNKKFLLSLLFMLNTYALMADIVNGKYGVAQVFDVQRSPATPVADQNFTASNMKLPYEEANVSSPTQYTMTDNQYIQFVINDPGTCSDISIKLFDQNASENRVIANGGSIYGLSQRGFLYISGNSYGTFVSNQSGFAIGDSVTYEAQTGQANCTELGNYEATTEILVEGESFCPSVISGLEWGNGSFDPAIYSGCQLDYSGHTVYYELQSFQNTDTVNLSHFSTATDPNPDAPTTGLVNLGDYSDVMVVKASCGTTYPAGDTVYSLSFESNTTYCGYVKTNTHILAIQGSTQDTKDQAFLNPSAKYYKITANTDDNSNDSGSGDSNSADSSSSSNSGSNSSGGSSSSSNTGVIRNTEIKISSGNSVNTTTSTYEQKLIMTQNNASITAKRFTDTSSSKKVELATKDPNGNTRATVNSNLDAQITVSDTGIATTIARTTDDTGNIININITTNTSGDTRATHKVTKNNIATTVNSQIDDSQTTIDSDGKVQTQAAPQIYTDPNGCTITASALTDTAGETSTIYTKICNGEETTLDSTIQNDGKFESGNIVDIYEENGDMHMKINTKVTRLIVF